MANQKPSVSVSDIQSRVGTVTRRANADPVQDSLQQALSVRKQILGQKMLEQAVSQGDAEAIEADNKRLAALAERRKLQQEANGKDTNDQYLQFLSDQIRDTQARLDDANKAVQEQQMAFLGERLAMLQAELAEARTSHQEKAPSGFGELRQQVEEARALVESISPPAPQPVVQQTADRGVIDAYLLKARLDYQRDELRVGLERERIFREQDLGHALEAKRLDIEERKAAETTRFMTETAPKLVEVFTQFVGKFAGMGGTAPAMAPTAMADVAPGPSRLAPGVLSQPCQNCGTPLYFGSNWPGVGCPGCGQWYALSSGPSPDEELQAARDTYDRSGVGEDEEANLS